MLLLLALTAALAADVPWYMQPTASPLHDPRHPFLTRWGRGSADVVGENLWFRDNASRLDVLWRLEQQRSAPSVIDAGLRDRALEQALAATLLGYDRALRGWASENDSLHAIHTIGRSVASPSVRVQGRPEGGRVVSVDDATSRDPRLARAQIDQGSGPRAAAPRSLHLGTRLNLVELPTQAEAVTTAPGPTLRASAQAYVQSQQLAVDVARVEAGLRAAKRPWAKPPDLAVHLIAREAVGKRWAVLAESSLDPSRPRRSTSLRGAVDLRGAACSVCTLRLAAGRAPAIDQPGHELRAELSLRTNWSWSPPQHPDRWPLGQRPLAPGLPAQVLRPVGKNEPRATLTTPAR